MTTEAYKGIQVGNLMKINRDGKEQDHYVQKLLKNKSSVSQIIHAFKDLTNEITVQDLISNKANISFQERK